MVVELRDFEVKKASEGYWTVTAKATVGDIEVHPYISGIDHPEVEQLVQTLVDRLTLTAKASGDDIEVFAYVNRNEHPEVEQLVRTFMDRLKASVVSRLRQAVEEAEAG